MKNKKLVLEWVLPMFFCFLFFLVFGFNVQAKVIEIGQPDWQNPSAEELPQHEARLIASDGTIIETDNGCFNVVSQSSVLYKRCWFLMGRWGEQAPFFVPSWTANWQWEILDENETFVRIIANAFVQGSVDMNMVLTADLNKRLHIGFAGQNGALPIHDLVLGYIFLPLQENLGAGSNNPIVNDLLENFGFDGNELVEVVLPLNTRIFVNQFSQKSLFDGGWHSTKVFGGRLNSFDARFDRDENAFLLLVELDENTILPHGYFGLGDVIEKSGIIETETWTSGNTYYVSSNVDVNVGQTLTIQPQVCVKFASETKLQGYLSNSTIIVDGNSTNPIQFSSVDDNQAFSGDFHCENVGVSDGVPTDANYERALFTRNNNLNVHDANFAFAQYGIFFGVASGGGGGSNDLNNLSFFTSIGIQFNDSTGEHVVHDCDFNVVEIGVNANIGSTGAEPMKTVRDSNFFCRTKKTCTGIRFGNVGTNLLTLSIQEISSNWFFENHYGIYVHVRGTGTFFGGNTSFLYNVFDNVFEDSDYGVRIDVNNGVFVLNNFFSNVCDTVSSCFSSVFSYEGNRVVVADKLDLNHFFNNLVFNADYGFVFETVLRNDNNNLTWRTPDSNNNTFSNVLNDAWRFEPLDNDILDRNGDITNNVFASTGTATNFVYTNQDYGGRCWFNGFHDSDVNSIACDYNRTANSTPFDSGQFGEYYLNDNLEGGHSFRKTGFLTIDGNLDARTARASNYEDSFFDSNRDLGYHYPTPDLNNQFYFPFLQQDINGILQLDFNVGSQSFNRNDLALDLNYSMETRQGTGTPITVDSTLANNPLFTCNDSGLNPKTVCHYIVDVNNLVNGTYYFLVRLTADSNQAFDASDANFMVANPITIRHVLWIPPQQDDMAWILISIGIVVFFIVVFGRR